jgi:hypothetical protein
MTGSGIKRSLHSCTPPRYTLRSCTSTGLLVLDRFATRRAGASATPVTTFPALLLAMDPTATGTTGSHSIGIPGTQGATEGRALLVLHLEPSLLLLADREKCGHQQRHPKV